MHEPETPHDQWMQTNNRVEDMDINGDTASWIVDCQDKRFQLDSNAARIIFQKNDDGTWSAVTSAFLW
jgi:hypothetical protein